MAIQSNMLIRNAGAVDELEKQLVLASTPNIVDSVSLTIGNDAAVAMPHLLLALRASIMYPLIPQSVPQLHVMTRNTVD